MVNNPNYKQTNNIYLKIIRITGINIYINYPLKLGHKCHTCSI